MYVSCCSSTVVYYFQFQQFSIELLFVNREELSVRAGCGVTSLQA